MENATSRKIRIYSERKVRNGIWSVSIPIMFLLFTRLLFLDISSWKLLLTWPLMLGITIFLNSRVGWVLDQGAHHDIFLQRYHKRTAKKSDEGCKGQLSGTFG